MLQERTHMEITNAITSMDHILQDVDNPDEVLRHTQYIRNRLSWLRRDLPTFFKEEGNAGTRQDSSNTVPRTGTSISGEEGGGA